MTEFTPEWIAKARNACIFFGEPATTEFIKALDYIEHLQARVQELEEALAKIANYESARFRLSPYEYGVLEQIVGIAEHALKGDR